ncbi:MAG: ribosome silencing factor [Legionellaceae bacterium]|nr:ribosome silencing factor [Legionellaceae bacterium]
MNKTTTIKDRILQYLDEMQAIDIVCIDVRNQTTITDDMLICSGRSSRHVQSIAEFVMEQMKHKGYPVLSKSGLTQGEWALLDFGDIILHVMQPDSRAYYNLEDLWQTSSTSRE